VSVVQEKRSSSPPGFSGPWVAEDDGGRGRGRGLKAEGPRAEQAVPPKVEGIERTGREEVDDMGNGKRTGTLTQAGPDEREHH
jgi:hypothetical protein